MKKINNTIINTKENIIEAATKLFYERGYLKTTYIEIAKEINLSVGAITYYYENKADLATDVFLNYNRKKNNLVARKIYLKYGKYEIKYGYTPQCRIIDELYYKDLNARRFYLDYLLNCYSSLLDYGAKQVTIYFDRRYKMHFNEDIDELSMISFGCTGLTHTIALAYYKGLINCSFDEFVKFRIIHGYQMLKYPSNEIEDFYNQGMKMTNELDYKFKPYFEVEIN